VDGFLKVFKKLTVLTFFDAEMQISIRIIENIVMTRILTLLERLKISNIILFRL
jgi:hypothetical protein